MFAFYIAVNTEHWTSYVCLFYCSIEHWTLNTKHWTPLVCHWTLNTEHWTSHVCLLHRLLQHSCGHQQVSAIHLNIDASDCGDAMDDVRVRVRDEDYPWKTNSARAPWPLSTAITAILKPVLLVLLILTGLMFLSVDNVNTDYLISTHYILLVQFRDSKHKHLVIDLE